MTRAEFLDAAYLLGLKYGASTTSWFRSDKHNKDVGGVPHSAHRFGLAVDLVYDTPPNKTDIVEDARRLGLLLIREGDHDHLQPRDWEAG
jgi:hypothetical protein